MQADSVFSGISTFGRLPYQPCLSAPAVNYDIAFIGMSHRTLARDTPYSQIQVPLSTPVPLTAPVPDLDLLVSARALAA